MSSFAGPADWWTDGSDVGRTHIATKGIVQSGLVLNLDAGVSTSYSGSGTTWTDLSGQGNTGTLTNGPTFSSTSSGGIVFDGVDDYISFSSNPTLTNAVTIEIWVKLSAPSTASGWLLGRETSYRIIYSSSGFTWVCSTVNNGWYSAGTDISVTGLTVPNNFFHIVAVYNGSNNLIYINGTLRNTGQGISGNITTNSTYNLMNNTTVDGSISFGKGSIYVHRMYNRALTAAEVQQNFNATRNRYGI